MIVKSTPKNKVRVPEKNKKLKRIAAASGIAALVIGTGLFVSNVIDPIRDIIEARRRQRRRNLRLLAAAAAIAGLGVGAAALVKKRRKKALELVKKAQYSA